MTHGPYDSLAEDQMQTYGPYDRLRSGLKRPIAPTTPKSSNPWPRRWARLGDVGRGWRRRPGWLPTGPFHGSYLTLKTLSAKRCPEQVGYPLPIALLAPDLSKSKEMTRSWASGAERAFWVSESVWLRVRQIYGL